MLRELSLERFKAFPGNERIPICPITLIYGPNSSGKSSIIQSLLLLKQTIAEAENPDVLLQPRGKLVDLGGFREFISRHDLAQSLSFTLKVSTDNWQPQPNWPSQFRVSQVGLRVSVTYDESLDTAVLSHADIYIGNDQVPAMTLRLDQKRDRAQRGPTFGFMASSGSSATQVLVIDRANYDHPFWQDVWKFRNARYRAEANQLVKTLRAQKLQLKKLIDAEGLDAAADAAEELQRKSKKPRLEKRIKEVESLIEKYQNYTYAVARRDFDQANKSALIAYNHFLPSDIRVEPLVFREQEFSMFGYEPAFYFSGPMAVVAVGAEVRRLLENLIYLGPLREYPERHYIFSGNMADDVGKTGKMVPDVLFKDSTLLKKLNEHLDAFNFGYQVDLSSTGDRPELHDVFAIRLLDKITRVNVSIVDVGIGISQVLPIIVQSMLSKGKTLLIEQPEIHLHPKLQSELANLFCEAIGTPYSNSFIVETHSEHLMLRLQRLVRNGAVKADQISVLYVDRTPDGSRCIPLRMNDRGDFLDRWPGGFFEESYSELFS